jgi:hypothetical protein
MNSKKLYDKVSGGLKKGVIATGLTALVLSSPGCATLKESKIQENYKVNTLSGLEGKSITQNDATYKIDGFDSGGVNYEILNPQHYKVAGKVYLTPAIVITNETTEFINYAGKNIIVQSERYFPIIPTQVIDKYLHVAPSNDVTREMSCSPNIKIPKVEPTHKGSFGFTSRENGDTKYMVPGMNLNNLAGFDPQKNKHALFSIHKGSIYPLGSTKHDNSAKLDSLPMVFFLNNPNVAIRRSKGDLCLEGRMYKPVIGTITSAPVVPSEQEFSVEEILQSLPNKR